MAHEAAQLRKEHIVAIKRLHEVIDIEKAIVRQIVKAIYPIFLRASRNRTTTTITKLLSEILEYRFDNYSEIKQSELDEK